MKYCSHFDNTKQSNKEQLQHEQKGCKNDLFQHWFEPFQKMKKKKTYNKRQAG